MKSKTIFFVFLGLAALMIFIILNSVPISAVAPIQNETPHMLLVSILYQGNWHSAGELAFEQVPSEGILDLSEFHQEGQWVFLRIQHDGATAAHLDAAMLDGIPPIRVYNTLEPASLALWKLAQEDFDLIDITSRTIYLVFQVPSGNPGNLALTARIDPEVLSPTPYQFPLENLYQEMSPNSAFYSYLWNSQKCSLTVDGDLEGELLGEPFVSEFITPGTGHPEGTVYWWVCNDEENMYAALDFVPDNTMDGDKDYAKVYLNTNSGLKSFKVSVPEQTWGKAGFVYTPRAVYQHKVYEYAIPLSELNMAELTAGTPLSLAFAAYGTVSPPLPGTFPGPLDPTFDGDGWLITDFSGMSGMDEAEAVAIQKDGKIVVAGSSLGDFALARYDVYGNLDPSFGTGGKLTTDFNSGSPDKGYAMVLQSDGKIVVVGESNDDFAVARYETDGDLDSTFSSDGKQTTDLGGYDHAHAVAIQEDGKIVLAGISDSDFAVARYDMYGELDTMNFGSPNGFVITDFALGVDYCYAVAIQQDGKIVAAGQSGKDVGLARYNTDGNLDTLFDGDGRKTLSFAGYDYSGISSMVILDDDKIMVAGHVVFAPLVGDILIDFLIARLNPNGSFDTSFGANGWLTTDFASFDEAEGLIVQHDGKFIAAGNSGEYMAVARYLPNGLLDRTFGTGGKANFYFNGAPPNFKNYGKGVAIQNDGKIVVAGSQGPAFSANFFVVRYAPPAIYLPMVKKE